MVKLLGDPAIVAGIALLITAVAALVQAKVAEVKADVAEKHAKEASTQVGHVLEQTSDLQARMAVTTEQISTIKEQNKS